MSKQIFWIASYPKSGNTLIRSILTSIFFTEDGIFSLEKLSNISQFERTDRIKRNKDLFGTDFSKLNNTPILYSYIEKLQTKKSLDLNDDFTFLKTHSGLFQIGKNSFTKDKYTRGIIYIVRDPRDISISWSKHLNISLDKTINNMLNDLASSPWMEPKNEIFNDSNRPMSFLSSWEKHVMSWTNLNWHAPIKVIRFEDLIYKKEIIIKEIIEFFEKNYNFKFNDKEKKIKNILDTTSFSKLKKEEKESGFAEGSGNAKFFSIGKNEQWKNKLSSSQIFKIEKKFGFVMKKLGYKLAVDI